MYVFSKIINKLKQNDYPIIKNELIIPKDEINLENTISFIKSKSTRKSFVAEGHKYAKIFLAYKTNKNLKELL